MTGPRLLALLLLGSCHGQADVGSAFIWPDGLAPCDPSAAEICNGRDDDCDGASDEEGVCDEKCRAVRLGARSLILADGEVRVWGRTGWNGGAVSLEPEPFPGLDHAVQVTGTCVRKTDGSAWCWQSWYEHIAVTGPVRDEDLKTGVAGIFQEIPVAPSAGVPTGPSWLTRCLRRFDDTLWCRGMTLEQSPRPPRYQDRATRVASLGEGVVQAAVGYPDICALKRDHTVWCWPGLGAVGEAGMAPVPALGANVVEIQASPTHVCARRADGTVACRAAESCSAKRLYRDGPMLDPCFGTWLGAGNDERVGAGTVIAADVFGTDVAQLALTEGTTCVLKREGSVSCVGRNRDGALGDGTSQDSATPVPVVGLDRDVVEIAPGCARKRDGSVWCWGSGPVGDGTRQARSIPVRIALCAATTAPGP